MENMKYVFVYITNPTKKEAEKIARYLLKKRLIVYANIFPIESLYWWKNKIEQSKEYVLIGKTTEKKYRKIVSEVEKMHSYSVPCVAKLPVGFSRKYKEWLIGEIGVQG